MRARQAGFTLVELITVMALIGILSAVALSRFADTSVYRQALFIDQVQSFVRLAQHMAMSHKHAPLNSPLQSISEFSLKREGGDQWRVGIKKHSHWQSQLITTGLAVSVDEHMLLKDEQLTISFNSQGDIVARRFPRDANPSLSTVLQVGDQALCIAPTGFSYEGSCI